MKTIYLVTESGYVYGAFTSREEAEKYQGLLRKLGETTKVFKIALTDSAEDLLGVTVMICPETGRIVETYESILSSYKEDRIDCFVAPMPVDEDGNKIPEEAFEENYGFECKEIPMIYSTAKTVELAIQQAKEFMKK
jgi:hypothetical protein